jgi:hypothetical protein
MTMSAKSLYGGISHSISTIKASLKSNATPNYTSCYTCHSEMLHNYTCYSYYTKISASFILGAYKGVLGVAGVARRSGVASCIEATAVMAALDHSYGTRRFRFRIGPGSIACELCGEIYA